MRYTAILASLFIAVSACAHPGVPAVAPTTDPIAEEVAWANKLCGISVDSSRTMRAKPEIDVIDLVAARKRFTEWLGLSIQVAERTIKDLEPLKTGPNTEAEKVVTHAITIVGEFKAAFEESRRTLEQANPADTPSIADAFTKVAGILSPIDEAANEFDESFRASGFAHAVTRAKNCDRNGRPFASTSLN